LEQIELFGIYDQDKLLPFLQTCVNVKQLRLEFNFKLLFDNTKLFPKLESFEINNMSSYYFESFIVAFTLFCDKYAQQLERLVLDVEITCEELFKLIQQITKLKKLKYLFIKLRIDEPTDVVENVNNNLIQSDSVFKKTLKEINYLDLIDSLKSSSRIYSSILFPLLSVCDNNIKSLSITMGEKQDGSITQFKQCHKVEKLLYEISEGTTSFVGIHSTFPNLKVLEIYTCSHILNLQDMRDILKLKQLEVLKISIFSLDNLLDDELKDQWMSSKLKNVNIYQPSIDMDDDEDDEESKFNIDDYFDRLIRTANQQKSIHWNVESNCVLFFKDDKDFNEEKMIESRLSLINSWPRNLKISFLLKSNDGRNLEKNTHNYVFKDVAFKLRHA
jgi:hypothetical protein